MAPPGYVTCQPFNATSQEPTDLGKDDLNALLYIVVTLLFYSMGIIIGIITYLKREQADMEEDKMFELYLSMKGEPFNVYKQQRVHQTAIHLRQIEETRLAREKIEIWNAEQHPDAGKPPGTSPCAVDAPLLGEHSGAAPAQAHHEPDTAVVRTVIPESEFAESRGASALLCSLTLNVCEPLLTPEAAKARLNFPGRPVLITPSDSSNMVCRTFPQRHSAPSICSSVRSSKSSAALPDDAFSVQASDCIIQSADRDDGGERRDSNLELRDIRLMNFDLTRVKFHNSKPETSDDIDVQAAKPPTTEPSCPPPQQIIDRGAPRRASVLKRQMRLEAERETPSPDLCQTEPIPSLIVSDNPVIDEEMANSCPDRDRSIGVARPSFDRSGSSTNTATSSASDPIQSTDAELYDAELELPRTSTPEFFPPSHQEVTGKITKPQSSTTAAAAAKPKLHGVPPTKIPTGSSLHVLPTDSALMSDKRLRSPRFDSWRQKGSRTLDIPDSRSLLIPEASSAARRKSADKRPTPRIQSRDNERRGALLFTQKSLHHIENEIPRSSGPKKSALKHQGSVDSYSSYNTEVSDLAESPLLLPAFHKSPPVQSNPDNPQRLPRRVPRLARSQTVDSSKSPQP